MGVREQYLFSVWVEMPSVSFKGILHASNRGNQDSLSII